MDIRRDNGKNSLDEIKRVQNELGFFFLTIILILYEIMML